MGDIYIFHTPSRLKGAKALSGRQRAARPDKHIQICVGKEHVYAVKILSDLCKRPFPVSFRTPFFPILSHPLLFEN